MSSDTLTVLTVILAIVVVAVLAVALILIRRGLSEISDGLGTLHSALEGVESKIADALAPLFSLAGVGAKLARKLEG